MFLIEKLPKESDNTANEPTSKISLLEKSLASTISHDFQTPWSSDLSQERESRFAGRTKIPYKSVPIDVPSLEKGEGSHGKLSLIKIERIFCLSKNFIFMI